MSNTYEPIFRDLDLATIEHSEFRRLVRLAYAEGLLSELLEDANSSLPYQEGSKTPAIEMPEMRPHDPHIASEPSSQESYFARVG